MKKYLILLTVLCLPLILNSQTSSNVTNKKLIIATKNTPPFAIKHGDGTWSGITIDLWQKIASELNISYEFEERDLKGMVDGLKDGSIDASVAALTITSERETDFDFTHPFYSTGLSIATIIKGEGNIGGALSRVFSLQFMKVILALVGGLLIIAIIVWLFEHKHNPEQFGGGFMRGIGNGFWWSAVTMTTVGYGDKAPRTMGGRLIGLVWMFTAVIIISSFTATITSVLTVSQLESPIKGPQDLPDVRVGTVANSTAAQYLNSNKIRYKNFATALDGLEAVENGQIEAMVYDQPILKYLVNSRKSGNVHVLPATFESQDYGIGLPENSKLREPINRAMLKILHTAEWPEILRKYMGD